VLAQRGGWDLVRKQALSFVQLRYSFLGVAVEEVEGGAMNRIRVGEPGRKLFVGFVEP
jgi:hypothetical protein